MLSSWLHKITLVNKSGISLAEFPESHDITKLQLESGITSALLTFSKEIHKQELESINLEDRRVYFIAIKNTIFVLEVQKDVNDEEMISILKEIKEKSIWLLADFDDDLTQKDARIILNEVGTIFQRRELLAQMQDLRDEFSLQNYKMFDFSYNLQTKEISGITQELDNLFGCNQMIDFFVKREEVLKTGILKSPISNYGMYLVVHNRKDKLQFTGLYVHNSSIIELISMKNFLDEQLNIILQMGYDVDLMNSLKSIIDNLTVSFVKLDEEKREKDWVSYNLLNHVFEDTSKIINSVIFANTTILVGDKMMVKQLIITLKSFITNTAKEITEWVKEDMELQFNLAGMDFITYKELESEFIDAVVIDVNTSLLINNNVDNDYKDNKYLNSLMNYCLENDIQSSIIRVDQEIQEITLLAYQFTNILNASTFNTLEMMINDSDKIDFVKKMANRLNPWIN